MTGPAAHRDRLRVGVVGTGNWARGFWSQGREAEEVQLVACYDLRREASDRFGAEFGCHSVPSLEEFLRRDDVDAVTIFTPNSGHREPVEAAAAAGKHVFVEKPIANSIEDARAMIAACRSHGVRLMVGHSTRYAPAMRALRGIIESGQLGSIAFAEGNLSHGFGNTVTAEQWRYHRAEAPGGPLIQLSVHLFDAFQYLLGPIKKVTALSVDSLSSSSIEDVFLALLEFESRVLAYVGTGYVIPSVTFVRLYGTAGAAYYHSGDGEEERITRVRTGNRDATESVPPAPGNPYADEMGEFGRAVRSRCEPETGGREALSALGVVWACIRSAEQGREVSVDEVLDQAELCAG